MGRLSDDENVAIGLNYEVVASAFNIVNEFANIKEQNAVEYWGIDLDKLTKNGWLALDCETCQCSLDDNDVKELLNCSYDLNKTIDAITNHNRYMLDDDDWIIKG